MSFLLKDMNTLLDYLHPLPTVPLHCRETRFKQWRKLVNEFYSQWSLLEHSYCILCSKNLVEGRIIVNEYHHYCINGITLGITGMPHCTGVVRGTRARWSWWAAPWAGPRSAWPRCPGRAWTCPGTGPPRGGSSAGTADTATVDMLYYQWSLSIWTKALQIYFFTGFGLCDTFPLLESNLCIIFVS